MKSRVIARSLSQQRSNILVSYYWPKKIVWGYVFAITFILLCSGCQTAPKKAGQESQQDVISAVGKMTEGLTNTQISQEDLKRLAVQMEKDPQARSAVESVNNAMQANQTGIRYCPVDGKRFSNRVAKCPTCGAKLEDLE